MLIFGKIKKIIKEAESKKEDYFKFESPVDFEIKRKKKHSFRFMPYQYSEKQRKEKIEELEKLKFKLENKRKIINQNKDLLYSENSIFDNVFVSKKILHFFNISISLNDDIILIKNNKKIINIDTKKIFSLSIYDNNVIVETESFKNEIRISGKFSRNEVKKEIDIYIINDTSKYSALFLLLIEVIIKNKNIY